MAVGQVISSYEPSMAMEGSTNSDKPENTLIIRQVEFIRRLGNLIIYSKYKKIFVNAVIWLDTLLILKGRDKMYVDAKACLEKEYNIAKNIEDVSLEQRVQYCIELFKEQLAYVNRSIEKDVWGGLDIDDEKLAEQEELNNDEETV